MKFRKPSYNANGGIDMEIQHPKFGWIPFTASPNDPEKHGLSLFSEAMDKGGIAAYIAPQYTPRPDPDLVAATQAIIDALTSSGTDMTDAQTAMDRKI